MDLRSTSGRMLLDILVPSHHDQIDGMDGWIWIQYGYGYGYQVPYLYL